RGALRRRGSELPPGERLGKLALAAVQMIAICGIGQQVEDKDFHWAGSVTAGLAARAPRKRSNAVATAAMIAKPQAERKICRGGKPAVSSQPPRTGARMPPRRPMPSAQPMPVVRIRAG